MELIRGAISECERKTRQMSTTVELSPELVQEFVISAHGDFAKMQEMLEKEPGLLNEKWKDFDENALEASGHMGRADIMNYLLDRGAPLTVFAAASLGNAEDVAAFMGENPALAGNTPGVHGISLLFHAALSGNIEVAEMIVAKGGIEAARDALHAAVVYGHRDMVVWLLDQGGDPNTLDWQNKTTLDVAQARGHGEVADLIRERGGVESEKE
jgi:ankyrin repeat protein